MTYLRQRINGSHAMLPATMAGLLKTAISDARSLNRKAYTPYYDEWHNPEDHRTCEVCLAGCVIAGRLKSHPGSNLSSMHFDRRTEDLLDALENMRDGRWKAAYDLLYNITPSDQIQVYLTTIPNVAFSNFHSWREFDAHLSSLEKLLPQLNSIDNATAQYSKANNLITGSPLPAI